MILSLKKRRKICSPENIFFDEISPDRARYFLIASNTIDLAIARNYQRPFSAECPGRFFAGQIPAVLSDVHVPVRVGAPIHMAAVQELIQ